MSLVKKNFIRKKENFICGNCGEKVAGTGYTNHCPNCLWSKHVDEEIPGDRACECHGLMKPVSVVQKHGEYLILHRCQKCGKTSKNRTSSEDNFGKIVEIAQGKR